MDDLDMTTDELGQENLWCMGCGSKDVEPYEDSEDEELSEYYCNDCCSVFLPFD